MSTDELDAANIVLDEVQKRFGVRGLTQIAEEGYAGPILMRGRGDHDKARKLIVAHARRRLIKLER